MRRGTFIAMLVGLFCLANVTRGAFRHDLASPRFVAEGAAHLRYTAMVADGRGLPSLDAAAQWPEGLRVWRETSPAMEYLFAAASRLAPGKRDLTSFIRFFSAFVFSLGIFPLAFASARLWKSRWAGLCTGLVFAAALPLVARSSGFDYLRENLAFPLLAFHLSFFAAACAGAGVATPILSAVFLFAALLSWQGAQFYVVPLLLFLLGKAIVSRIDPSERRAVRALIIALVGAGLAVPYLREGRLLLSIPAALAAAWLLVDLCVSRDFLGLGGGGAARIAARGTTKSEAKRGARPPEPVIARTAVAAVAAAAILVPGMLAGGHFESYSHFFSLVLYKLRYVVKPDDPRALPFDARAFWVGPFNSPDLLHFFVFALPMLLVLPWPVVRLARRSREEDAEATFALSLLVMFFLLYLLMQRLEPLFGFFAAVAAGGNAVAMASGRRLRRGAAAAIAVAVIAVSLLQDFEFEGRRDVWRGVARALRVPSRESFVVFPYGGDVEGELLAWIRRNTPPEAVVMTLHYLSPQVLTYTGRATNLNDFFEAPRLRRKAERFLTLLYSSEEELYRFCASQSSSYLLVSCAVGCDPTKESPLYQAGLVNMPPGCAAYRLAFEPEKLSRFDLVYENEMYRLFAVGRGWSERAWPRSPLFYERELLWNENGDIEGFYNAAMHVYALTARGRSQLARGNAASGESSLVEALHVFYFYPAWRLLDDLYVRRGRAVERARLAEFAYRYDPNRVDICLAVARCRLDGGTTEGVREILERCASLPGAEARSSDIGEIKARLDTAAPR